MLNTILMLKEDMKIYYPEYYTQISKVEQENLIERVDALKFISISWREYAKFQEMKVLGVYINYLLNRINVLQPYCNFVYFKSGLTEYLLNTYNKVIEKIKAGGDLKKDLMPLQTTLYKYLKIIFDNFFYDINGKLVNNALIEDYYIMMDENKKIECSKGTIDSIHHNIQLLTLILNFYYYIFLTQYKNNVVMILK